jgi:TolA-binding protein
MHTFSKTIRQACLASFLFCVSVFTSAQTTLVFSADDLAYRNGIELYDRQKYGAAQKAFQDYIDLGKNDLKTIEAEYYVAITGLYLENSNAEAMIERFIANHPDHAKAEMAYYELGNYYFNQKDYDKAIEYLQKVKPEQLSQDQRVEAQFKLAYSYFSKQKFTEAGEIFNTLKQSENKYTYPASYYSGYIAYRNGKYDEALVDLRRAAKSEEYAPLVPYMIANVYYKQQKYDELIAYGETLKGNKDIRNADEVFLLVGEAYYRKGDYVNAAKYLKESVAKGKGRPAPEVAYRLGYAQYKTGDFKGATENLKVAAANGKDTLAQYAAYHLGLSYLQSGNKTFALSSFDQARRGKASKEIAEEAAFYHAKVNYEAGNNAEATVAFKDFQKNYPRSKHNTEVNELLGEAYLNSNSYGEALSHLESVKNNSPRTQVAYQRVTYNRGVELFNKDQFTESIPFFQKSLESTADKDLGIAAHFWMGEAHSANRNYTEAINQYAAVFREPNAKNTEYYLKSRYGIGYAYYNTKEFDKALPHFREYVDAMRLSGNKQNYTDALVRLADCYYVAKSYDDAIRMYDQAIAQNTSEKDYALFQKGIILGLTNRSEESKKILDNVASQYPNSRYADNALYQRAEVDFEKGQYQSAIAGYTKLITQKSTSSIVPFALQKRALAYNNIQKYNEAIADYQRILNQYPSSKVGSSALTGLQETLASAGRSDELGSYLGKYREANPQDNSVESVEYEAAKSLYVSEKYQKAIQSLEAFIQRYPNNSDIYDARYYVADSYFRLGDRPNAVKNFQQVLSEGRSQFVNRSVSRLADLELGAKNYPAAVKYFRSMLAAASTKKDQVNAFRGLMDAYYGQSSYDSTRHFAEQIISAGSAAPAVLNRALLYRGKTYFDQGDYQKAIDELLKTVNSAQDEYGAEAQYLIGESLYKQKQYKQSLEALFLVNQNFSAYDKWRSKAFLLIADDYVALEEAFQAKATLQSIIENAEDPEIVSQAKAKLKVLESQKPAGTDDGGSGNKKGKE